MAQRVFSFDIGIRHLALADMTYTAPIADVSAKPVTMNRWAILPLVADDVKVKTVGLDTLAEALYATLDEWYPHGEVDPMPATVYIENQPALKNPMMKSVQMLVYGYFAGRRLWMAEGGLGIQLVSASQKVKWAQRQGYVTAAVATATTRGRKKGATETEATSSVAAAGGARRTYAATKRAAVIAVEAVLPALFNDPEPLLAQFRASKKKDDLADCLLQGLSALL